MKNRNQNILNDFIKYCEEHPCERFWQALRNWSTYAFIYASDGMLEDYKTIDTFYFEGKNQ